jgi:type I restriction enzyme S subunit
MTDWPVKTLGDICEVFDDGDWIESKDQAPSGVRLIQTGNVGDGEFKDRSDKARFISESTFSRLRCTEIFPGDLLVSRLPDPVGRACLIPDTGSKMITAVDCTIMRPRKDIMLPQFLVSSTQTSGYREQVRAKITGTTRDRISRSHLAEVQVSVPPLDEQKRIVALLDAATAHVTELTACYEQARTHANNLFTSALRNALESNPDWPMGTLGSIFRVCSSKRVLKSEWRQTGVPFYRGREITLLSKYGIVDNELFISEDHFSELVQKYGVPKLGDIMITAIGTIGNSYVVKESDQFYFKDASVIWLDKHADIMSGYVQYWISSSKFRDQLNTGNGATVDTLTIDSLSKMQISMPPLEEQKQIIARLDSMKAKTSEMVAAYDAKLTAAKNLRQSILEAAFAGDL